MGAALFDGLAFYHAGVREALGVVAVGFLLASLDGVVIDLAFVARGLRRRLFVYRRHTRARADRLDGPGAPMTILVPAWDEAAVIAPMLRTLFATIDYPDYRVFVGVYPNDPATIDEVRTVVDPRLTLVTCLRPGPTTKADCLNQLWRGVIADETARGRRFAAVVLHDAEDVVDAWELRVFDHLVPRLAMVQLPVVPLPQPESPWIAGHYLDEFAEAHVKDVVVREAWGAAVPSAGVGCAIARDMLECVARAAGGAPFDPTCLTEDYELGVRIKVLGGRTALVRIARPDGSIVATRAFFPATLDTAVRQKARWLVGIALQGWDRLGWRGGLADRLMLLRDRKAIAASALTAAGYLTGLLVLADAVLLRLVDGAGLPPLVPPGGWLQGALTLSTGVMVWRLLVRALCTTHVYGWREGLSSLPRAVAANLINALASWRALHRYAEASSGIVAWDKTAHRFPAA